MTAKEREQQLEMEIIEGVLQWSAEKVYSVFGPWLETIVNIEKEKRQLKLKTIWRNRKWYAHHDTGEQFDNDTMLYFFDPKKIAKYSLSQLTLILDKIENETIYSNPNTTTKSK